MTKPTNLPENLNSVRDRLIDFAYGRLDNLPMGNEVNEFVIWMESNECLSPDVKDALAFDMIAISQRGFDDCECAGYECLDEEDLTDEIRFAYAKKRMEYFLDEVDSDVKSLLGAELENALGEQAYFCTIMEGNPFEGFRVGYWDMFKDFEVFKTEITEDGDLIFAEELEATTMATILKWWKKDEAQVNLA